MALKSAGLLMYREHKSVLEVLLAHPGGPYWARKDQGAWTIPKGKIEEGEEPMDAAKREFREETGFEPIAPFVELGTIRQKSGKYVSAWGFLGDADPAQLRSVTHSMEWPTNSGRFIDVPEIDRVVWCDLSTAARKIIPAQRPFLSAIERHVRGVPGGFASGGA